MLRRLRGSRGATGAPVVRLTEPPIRPMIRRIGRAEAALHRVSHSPIRRRSPVQVLYGPFHVDGEVAAAVYARAATCRGRSSMVEHQPSKLNVARSSRVARCCEPPRIRVAARREPNVRVPHGRLVGSPCDAGPSESGRRALLGAWCGPCCPCPVRCEPEPGVGVSVRIVYRVVGRII